MVRTQVYFTEEQHRALRGAAEREGTSMSGVLRRLIECDLLEPHGPLDLDQEALLALVGLGTSGERRTGRSR